MFLLGKDYRAGFPHSEGDPQRESPWPLLHQLTLFSAQSPQRLELSHRAKSCALKAHLSQDSLAPDCGLQNWGVDFSWFVCMFACLFLKFRNIDDIKTQTFAHKNLDFYLLQKQDFDNTEFTFWLRQESAATQTGLVFVQFA